MYRSKLAYVTCSSNACVYIVCCTFKWSFFFLLCSKFCTGFYHRIVEWLFCICKFFMAKNRNLVHLVCKKPFHHLNINLQQAKKIKSCHMIFHAQKKKNWSGGLLCKCNSVYLTLIKHFSIAVLFAANIEDVTYEYNLGWTVYVLQALCL